MVSPVQGLSHGSHEIQQSEGSLDLKGRIYSTAEVGSHGQLQGGEEGAPAHAITPQGHQTQVPRDRQGDGHLGQVLRESENVY